MRCSYEVRINTGSDWIFVEALTSDLPRGHGCEPFEHKLLSCKMLPFAASYTPLSHRKIASAVGCHTDFVQRLLSSSVWSGTWKLIERQMMSGGHQQTRVTKKVFEIFGNLFFLCI